ncbi:hypothetical protein Glove_246g14 [Diversispora epigaea]|uniref:Uncharacterized protein n=1 Tax=Diversispora epigaea TaxID=1348612 RepID=A0A397I8K7_9GLOM|nr:hypothetical protein Glove_246g14 [Diversispora epigaea]
MYTIDIFTALEEQDQVIDYNLDELLQIVTDMHGTNSQRINAYKKLGDYLQDAQLEIIRMPYARSFQNIISDWIYKLPKSEFERFLRLCKTMDTQLMEDLLEMDIGSQELPFEEGNICGKRSKNVQERINEEKRMVVDKATKILRPLFNLRQNKMTFDILPLVSEVHIKKKQSGESEERRSAIKKANEILQIIVLTFDIPPPISEVLIKKKKGEKGKGVDENEKTKESKEKVLEKSLIEVIEVMEVVEIKIPQISAVPIKKRK